MHPVLLVLVNLILQQDLGNPVALDNAVSDVHQLLEPYQKVHMLGGVGRGTLDELFTSAISAYHESVMNVIIAHDKVISASRTACSPNGASDAMSKCPTFWKWTLDPFSGENTSASTIVRHRMEWIASLRTDSNELLSLVSKYE